LLTDKQTNSDENITSLSEVDETRFHDINVDKSIWRQLVHHTTV